MIAGWLALACAPAPEADAATGDPGEALRAYFDAVERRDCAALEAAQAEAAAREFAEVGCTRTLAEFEEHDASLASIESAAPDGRDASLYLVRATLREGGRDKPVVIGVRWVDGRWRVVRM